MRIISNAIKYRKLKSAGLAANKIFLLYDVNFIILVTLIMNVINMPQKEVERLQAVHRFLKLDFSKEDELQEIVELAARICGTTTALITFIDQDTQYIKFKQAFDFETTSKKDAFCRYTVEQNQPFIIPDTLLDERFISNPLVIGDPNIRFYAGVPLTTSDGHNLGSLCVISESPGMLTANQEDMLKALAKQTIQLMEFDASLKILKDLYIETKKSEVELRSFFESSIELHLLLGRNFEILAFNKSWERHVQNTYGLQMQKGENMISFINSDHLSIFYKDYLTALKGTAVYDERNLRQKKMDNWRMVKFEPAFDATGEIIGVSINVADVNKRVEHEMTVKAQNEQLREIAFIQTHEFRKPVASILGLLDLIRLDGRNNDMAEWFMLEKAVMDLDDKVRMIVGKIHQ